MAVTEAPKRRGRPPKADSARDVAAEAVSGTEGESGEALPPITQHEHTRRRSDPNKRVGELELGGLKEEAWFAYDMQDEYVRFDTTGRKWTFRPEQTNGHAEMLFEVRKGEDVRSTRLSMAAYGTETAREQSDKAVADLDGAL